jgi:transposase-like protein
MADDGGSRALVPFVSLYSADLGLAICARVAAGESVAAICRDLGSPDATTVRNWTTAHPEFGAALASARRTARIAARLADRRARARKAAGRERPPQGAAVSTYTREAAEAICSRIANGESMTSIARDPALPSYETIYRWIAAHDEFEDLYVTARQVQADYLFDEARDVALGAQPGNVWVARLQFDVIRWQTARMAPKKYCERLVVDAGIAERRAQDDPEKQGLTVIIKRFDEVTPEEEEAARLTEEGYFDRGRGRRR